MHYLHGVFDIKSANSNFLEKNDSECAINKIKESCPSGYIKRGSARYVYTMNTDNYFGVTKIVMDYAIL
jgi:hypothetical protein